MPGIQAFLHNQLAIIFIQKAVKQGKSVCLEAKLSTLATYLPQTLNTHQQVAGSCTAWISSAKSAGILTSGCQLLDANFGKELPGAKLAGTVKPSLISRTAVATVT